MRALRLLSFAIALFCGRIATADVRIVLLDMRADKAKREVADTLSQLIADALARSPGVQPIGGDELATNVDEEARKQLRGCDDDSACIIEIGGAIGADYFLVSSLGTIGTQYVLGLRLLSAKTGQVSARVSRQVAKDDDLLAPVACPLAQELLAAAAKKDKRVSGDAARCRGKAEKRAEPARSAPARSERVAGERDEAGGSVVRVSADERTATITFTRPDVLVAARGDVEPRVAAAWGGAVGATAIVGRKWGGVVSLMTNFSAVTALRLEGRGSLPLGPVRGYATLGLTFLGGSTGLRASAGAQYALDDVRLFADLAWELFPSGGSSRDVPYTDPLLLGAGVGYVF